MANADHSDKNRLKSFAAAEFTLQTVCPFPAGSVGYWLDNADSILKYRKSDGTDLKVAPFFGAGGFRMIKNVPGHNLAGPCTATGAKVGDIVMMVSFAKVPTAVAGTQAGLTAFEGTITIADQIQQTAAVNLSSEDFDVLLLAQS